MWDNTFPILVLLKTILAAATNCVSYLEISLALFQRFFHPRLKSIFVNDIEPRVATMKITFQSHQIQIGYSNTP